MALYYSYEYCTVRFVSGLFSRVWLALRVRVRVRYEYSYSYS